MEGEFRSFTKIILICLENRHLGDINYHIVNKSYNNLHNDRGNSVEMPITVTTNVPREYPSNCTQTSACYL